MTMCRALRELDGKGPVEVLTRLRDFNIQTVQGPKGAPVDVPADTLIAFMATSFRELLDDDQTGSDVWAFRTTQPLEGGAAAVHHVYLRGDDVFMLRVPSQVAVG